MGKPPGVFNVAVEGVIIKDGKILITQRSFERPHAPGEWEILTGRVDQGEGFEEALKREVMEEVGLEVEVLQPFNTFHFFRGQEKTEHLGVSFVCRYKGGNVKLDKTEQIEFKWTTPDEALKLIIDPSIQSSVTKVKQLIEKGIGVY
ncbi:MAG: NUDIX domain-containing protein [Desulfobacteraceae bacterium]|jgi:mutator protein MutT